MVCLLLDPRFAGLIPAESDGFLMAIKSAACLPLEGKQSRWRHVRFYMLKIPFKYEQIYFLRPNSSFTSLSFFCFATR
jgi:hypothetical protein